MTPRRAEPGQCRERPPDEETVLRPGEELCSKYGPIDILWYDGGWLAHKGSDTSSAWFWEPVKLNKMVRKYNPKTLLNPRSGYEGDFYCDEGSHEITGKILPVPWEKNMCVCSGCSWGWMADDPVSDFDWLIRMLANVICRGGNLLLNVGPDKDGHIRSDVARRMREIGAWLSEYGEAVYGTRGGPIEPVDNVYGTVSKGDKNLSSCAGQGCLRENADSLCRIPGGAGHGISRAALPLHTGREGITIDMDGVPAAGPDTIFVLKLDRPVEKEQNQEVYFSGR